MALMNNFFRDYRDGMVEGSAHALLPRQWDAYRQQEKFINPDMATAVLSTVANPPGHYLPNSYHPPITAGEMAFRTQGNGILSGYMYPAMQMTVALTGIGTMTLDIQGRKSMSVSMTGSGALSASIQAKANMLLDLIGSGDLEGAMAGAVDMAVDLQGSGNLEAIGSLVAAMVIAMTGSGNLSAAASGRIAMAIDLAGSGDVEAGIEGRWDMEADLTGEGGLEADINALGNMLIEMTGAGDLDAAIAAVANMSVDIVVTGSGLSVGNIASAVWSSIAAQNNDVGTMGDLLNNVSAGNGASAQEVRDALFPDLDIINEGVKKASLDIPHNTDLE
jgi:hypothetical protein